MALQSEWAYSLPPSELRSALPSESLSATELPLESEYLHFHW